MAEAQLELRFIADTSSLTQGLGAAKKETTSFASHVTKAFGGVTSAITAPVRAVGTLTSALGKIGLAGLGIQTLAGTARGLADTLGVGLNVQLENVQAQLLAFTKDGGEAARILEDIRTEAAKTPFAFQEMAKATASLLPASKQSGVALMDLIKQAEILAALNPAEGLEGAAFSLREALSGDFVSIVERFNLPRQRLNELKEQGVPALEAVRIAMNEMGADASLVSNLATTASGRWSTFLDTIDTLRASLARPLFEFLSRGLSQLQGLLDQNMPTLEAFAQTAGQTLADAVQTGARLVTDTLLPGLRDLLATGRQLLGQLDLAGLFERLGQAWADLAPTGQRLGDLLGTIKGAVAALVPSPLVDIVQAFRATTAAAMGGRDALKLLTDAINAVSGALADAAVFIRENAAAQVALAGVVGGLATAWTVSTAATIAHTVATRGVTLATQGLAAAQRVLNLVLAANPIGLVITVLGGLAVALVQAYHTSEDFRTIVDGAFSSVRSAVEKAVTTAIGLLGGFMEAIRAVVDAIGGLLSAIGRIPSTISLPSLPGLDGAGMGFPSLPAIPTLDHGAIVTAPTLAALAMNSRPEAVIPLDQLARPGAVSGPVVQIVGPVYGFDDFEARVAEAADRAFRSGRLRPVVR